MPHRAPIAKSHRNEHADRDRLRRRRDGVGRLYDSLQWRRRTTPHVLARDPFCKLAVLCGGHAPSTDVDHIIPAVQYVAQHGGDERYFFDENNLQGACHADHSRKTRIERRGGSIDPMGKGGSVSGGGTPATAFQPTANGRSKTFFPGEKLK